MKELGRLLTAMITPFNEEGEVDYEQAKKLALALLNSGSDGILVAATTGESPTLTREEEQRLFREVKSVVDGRGSMIAYTGLIMLKNGVTTPVDESYVIPDCRPDDVHVIWF